MARPLVTFERTNGRLSSAARVLVCGWLTSSVLGPIAARAQSHAGGAVQACDRLASAPWDPDAPDPQRAVAFRDLRAVEAVAACREAIERAPRLGRLHFQLGRGLDRLGANQDAFEAYRRASELGSGAAKVNIGILYRQGRRFEKSEIKARAWFRDAAESGIPEGMYCYATAFDNGIGGPPDAASARAWYAKAAERGTAKARDALVHLEIDGAGTGARCD